MYLVHAHVEMPGPLEVPPDIRELVQALLRADSRAQVEHLAVHLRSAHLFTLGFFLLSERWELAEKHAAEVCGRMLKKPPLHRARLLGTGAPPIGPAFDVPWRCDP
ncbi:hypothetical protein [Streptomyces sp. NPDC057287]|uniref:hypothetical protein n=1 Tax=Streptomyces sp. NPDC057287 TaxID=3346086 RepID=UPI0036416A8E